MEPTRLLFVCTGNICRSPMAEALAIHRAQQLGMTIEAQSAGVLAKDGLRASKKAVRALSEQGLNLESHRSQMLTASHLDWATRVFVMQLAHVETIQERFPNAPRAELLGPLCGTMEIDDPYGSWFMRPYRTSRDRIRTAVQNLSLIHI